MNCPHCGATIERQTRARKAPKLTPTVAHPGPDATDAQIHAYYKATAPAEDVAAFLRLTTLPTDVRTDALVLYHDARHGLKRTDVLGRLVRLQARWREARDGRQPNEALFWRQVETYEAIKYAEYLAKESKNSNRAPLTAAQYRRASFRPANYPEPGESLTTRNGEPLCFPKPSPQQLSL